MRTLILLLFFIGILMVAVGYVNQLHTCNSPQVEYRYIPRTFEEEQENPAKVSQIFSSMFSEPTPWIAGFGLGKPSTQTGSAQVNKYLGS